MSTTQVTSESCPATDHITGQVKWFNTKAGYGFITVCEGEHSGKDIFVHYSSIKVVNSQYRYLVQGEYVDFCIVKPENDKYEYHAVDVSGVKGGLIMCETRRASYDTQPRGRPNARKYRGQRENGAEEVESSRKRPVQGDDAGFEKVIKKRTVKGRAPPPK
jgi:CspA family cold shock protein